MFLFLLLISEELYSWVSSLIVVPFLQYLSIFPVSTLTFSPFVLQSLCFLEKCKAKRPSDTSLSFQVHCCLFMPLTNTSH